jgi:hypothetical protein
MEAHTAIGTSLGVLFPTMLFASVPYIKKNIVSRRIVMCFGIPAMGTAALGGWLSTLVHASWLMLAIAAYVVVIGARMWGASAPATKWVAGASGFISIGIICGLLAGLLGVGAGVILVPVLVLGAGLPMKRAVGNSLATMALYTGSGAITHALLGHLNLALVVPVLIGTTLGSQLGAKGALKTRDAKLRRIFAVLLFLIAFAIVILEILRGR